MVKMQAMTSCMKQVGWTVLRNEYSCQQQLSSQRAESGVVIATVAADKHARRARHAVHDEEALRLGVSIPQ